MRIKRIVRQCGARALAGVTILCLLQWLTFPSIAQTTTATISGEVTDPNGAAVAGAKITGTNVNTNLTRTVTTDSDGRFVILALMPGNYDVQAEQQGFSRELRRGIVLTVGRDAVVNFELKVGAVADEVIISGDASQVNVTSAEISGLVDAKTIVDLPLNGRDIFQLATLNIGVATIPGALREGQIDSGTGNVLMSINGGRLNFNNFQLDDISVNDVQNTTPGSVTGAFTGVDAIQEFRVFTNSFSAVYGGAGSGVISMVSKSGSNSTHGTGFWFFRESALDARNFFDGEDAPPFTRNQFGGSIGGPIRKDKIFYFGAYEGFRQDLTRSQRFFVPDNSVRAGVRPGGGLVSPEITPYINLYPQANGENIGGGQAVFVRTDPGETREDYFSVRVDGTLSGKDSVFGRFTFDDSDRTDPRLVIQNTFLEARNQYLTLGDTHIFSPNAVNTIRVGYSRTRVFGDDVDTVPIPQDLLFTPTAPTLGFFRQLGGLSPLSDRVLTPRFLVLNAIDFSEQLAYTRGSHNLKFGFAARRIQFNAVSTNTPFGGFIFGSYNSFLTANPLLFAAPLSGQDDAYRGIRTTQFSFYVQDDWKVRNNLTLNLGLRYEFMTGPDEVNGKLSNVRNVLTDTAPTVGAPFFKNNSLRNFAPRFGFAWDIFGDGKTSLRGGYGIYHAQLYPASYRFEMSNQPPFFLIGLAFFPGTVEDVFDNLADIPGIVALQTFEFEPKASYVQQWNLSLQRDLFAGMTATVAYVGGRGVHLTTNANRNTSANFTIDEQGKLFPPGQNPLRNPAFGAIRSIFLNGDSLYNALQVNVARRFARGLQFQLAYTYSKSLDTASDAAGIFQYEQGQLPQDPYDLKNDRGLSAFDLRNIFSLNVIYDLPYKTESGASGGRRVADLLLGGWQVNSIITAQSGTPFNPTISFNNSNDGNTDNVERPSWAPGATPDSAVTGNPNGYFTPSAFIVAPPGRFGNVARNALIGPGLATVDLSLIKSNRIGERFTIELRAEAFNLLNRANFALPCAECIDVFAQDQDDNIVVPPNAGVITSTATTSRQLQFGVKFIF